MQGFASGLFACLIALAPLAAAAQQAPAAAPAPAAASSAVHDTIAIPPGDLLVVALQSDIGSRISNEGDTFAVLTADDYYVNGKLVLPKGSPGYGVITHVKRAGSFHAGGELTFTVKRLIAPDGTEIAVATNGSTSDADKQTEKNGSELGSYLMFGVGGLFAHRGNDMLVKKGSMFHVATAQTSGVPVAAQGATPANIDLALVKHQ